MFGHPGGWLVDSGVKGYLPGKKTSFECAYFESKRWRRKISASSYVRLCESKLLDKFANSFLIPRTLPPPPSNRVFPSLLSPPYRASHRGFSAYLPSLFIIKHLFIALSPLFDKPPPLFSKGGDALFQGRGVGEGKHEGEKRFNSKTLPISIPLPPFSFCVCGARL